MKRYLLKYQNEEVIEDFLQGEIQFLAFFVFFVQHLYFYSCNVNYYADRIMLKSKNINYETIQYFVRE